MADPIAERVRRYILDGSDEDLRRLLTISEHHAEAARRAFRRVGIQERVEGDRLRVRSHRWACCAGGDGRPGGMRRKRRLQRACDQAGAVSRGGTRAGERGAGDR